MEKCLDALEIFIEIGDPSTVANCQNDIIKVLIDKCIGHAKPTIKQKGLECFNLLFEVTECFEDSVGVFEESLKSKNIKVKFLSTLILLDINNHYGYAEFVVG